MTLVLHLLLVLHLIGWAMVLGGVLANLKKPVMPTGALHGILTAVVTGLLMTGILSAGLAGDPPNNAWVAVKLVIALVVTGLVVVGVRSSSRVTRGYLGGIAGLVVANVAIAVLWA